MALAPSKWPPGSKPPPPPYAPTRVAPLGDVTLAALRATMHSSPQPSDFETCTSKLVASLARSTSWRYNASASTSPSYAYFTGQDFIPEQPFDIECWVGVARLAASS
jgi:hypothetical protein